MSEVQHVDPRLEKLFTKVEILEEKYKSMSERLAEQGSTLKQINAIASAVDKQTLIQQQMLDKLQDHEKRLNAIEQKPVKRWDSVVDKIIMVILGAVLAYVLTKFGL